MGNMSTFGTFTMARLGIYVSQHALNVTGNNITNINTNGYTRQMLDQSSMYYGAADRYQSRFDIRANGGVMAQGVYQLRDQYLDIRYRNEVTRVGEATQKLSGLQQLSDILDEVAMGDDGDGVLEARLNDLIQQLENLSRPENSNKEDMDSIVRSAAEALTTQFHDYANQLATLKENMTARFREEVEATNAILTKIRNLNEEIRKSEIFGGSALTLRDERNLLIDDLAAQMGIHVIYETEDLGDGTQVEKLKIMTSGDPSRTLIDGIYGTQLTILDENNYDLSLSQLKSSKGKLMPKQPNQTRMTTTGIETWDKSGKVDQFDSEEDALAKLEELNLNGDTKYTVGNDGKLYYYSTEEILDPDTGAGTGKWVIRQQERIGWEDDGVTPILKPNTTLYVQTVESQQAKLSDTELSGGLQAMREMMTEAGEYSTANDPALKTDDPLHYDPDAGTKRGIPYYRKALDTLANTFARIMNEANMMQDNEIYQTDENGDLTATLHPAHYIPEPGFEKFFETDGNGNYVYEKNPDGSLVYDTADDGTQVARLVVKAEYREYMNAVASGLYQTDDGGALKTDDDGNYIPKEGYEKFFEQNEDGSYVVDPADPPNLKVKDEYKEYAAAADGETLYQKGADDTLEVAPAGPSHYTPRHGFEKYFETDEKGNYVFETVKNEETGEEEIVYDTDENGNQIARLKVKDEYKDYMGWPLFSNNANGDDMTGITAANISVSAGWESGQHRILRSKDPDAENQSTLQDNLDHMLTLLMSEHEFKTNSEPGSSGVYFKGTFQEMFTDTISGTLAKDANITSTMLSNYSVTAEELYIDRDAVMGVDLNDETMSMMQYQKAYSAACRLMTTFDSMLERLINGMAM